MIAESILELHKTNATYESIKSYDYDEYQPITGQVWQKEISGAVG